MTAHWGVPDPSTAEGKEAEKRVAFVSTFRMLQRRIDVFTSLPLASLRASRFRKRSTISDAWLMCPRTSLEPPRLTLRAFSVQVR